MMESLESGPGDTYRIKVKGTLGHRTMDWFGDLTITLLQNGETMLVGQFTDQSALRGFLDQLWDLNLTVLSVEVVDNQTHLDPNA
jgi:hypothetical protein